jgi:hypothetical protein
VKNGTTKKEEIRLGQLTERPKHPVNVLRRSVRIPYFKKLKYGLLDHNTRFDPAAQKFSGYTFNLSENGLGIEGSRGFPPKFNIQATLYTGNSTLKIKGVVRWLHLSNPEKWFMGIEVTSRTDEIKEIYTYLNNICDFDL